MVKYEKQLDNTFKALGDKTRRAILLRLTKGDVLVTDLAEPFDMSLPAISKHLSVLESAGLITRIPEGRQRRCHLEVAAFEQASDWFDFYKQFWATRLDKLTQILEQDNKNED